ncbi:MAG: O-antigen ligase family protein [Gammaproteobacteria bacterium]|nr:O-antigen ligase family protein [Gammaproteobacteria bacterium]
MKQAVDIKDLYALKVGALWSALRAEHLSLWMLCMYFFFEYVRPQSIYPELDILPWAQLFLIASILAAFSDRSVHWVGNGQNKLMILFAMIIIMSGLFAFKRSASLDYWSVFAGWLIVYFLVISIVNTETRLILFLLAYCLFSLKMAQHGAVSWAMRGFSFASYGLVGAPGWFSNSGEYAIQMIIYGSLSVSMVVALKQYWGPVKKWLLYLAAAMGYMSVMGASSRGSQIGLAVIGIWMLLKMKNGFKGLIVIIILATALYYLLPDEQMERFAEMGDDKNSLQRLAYWQYAIHEIIPKYPVLGIGYHNWIYYLAFKVPEGMGPLQKVQESHNIYIQATSELGFIGLFGFLWLIVYAFINNARTRRCAKELKNTLIYYLTFGLDAGLIGYLVAGSFVTVLYYPFFWIQVAMIVMLNNIANTMLVRINHKIDRDPETGALLVEQVEGEKKLS